MPASTVHKFLIEGGISRSAFYKITVTENSPQEATPGSVSSLASAMPALGGIQKYTVTWEPNGGTLSGSATQTLSTISSLPAASNEDYALDGWYAEDGSKAAVGTTLERDTIYTAKWVPACSHPATRTKTFEATETEMGERVTYCSSCGEVLDVEYLLLKTILKHLIKRKLARLISSQLPVLPLEP